MTQEFFITPAADVDFSTRNFCALKHNLHEHELLQLESLQGLAERLMPIEKCRFVKPDIKPDSAFWHESEPQDGRSLEAVFQNIEEPGSWIALYDVQLDPIYDAFMKELMGYAEKHVTGQEEVRDVRGFIFISAPPSVTPFHIDRENNFWLQVSGQKDLYLWDHRDERVVPRDVVSDFIWSGSLKAVKLNDDAMQHASVFRSKPGDGAYFPSTTPHMTRSDTDWTSPDDGVAISIGVVFYTDKTRREAYVHACNRVLRKLGFRPRDPGESHLADSVKSLAGRFIVGGMRLFRGYKPTASFEKH